MSTNKRAPWNDQENAALVALYFAMLDAATSGKAYNKAALIRKWQGQPEGVTGPLEARSRGSIEAKLMNASAAHRDLIHESGELAEFKTMASHGYKAWGNYQSSLKTAMENKLETRRRCYIGSDGRRFA